MTGNPLPLRTDRLLDQEKFRNAARAAGLERVVFLAGPYIETAKSPRKNAKNKAAVLRYRLYHALEADGWIVTLGEYEKLIEAADPLLGDHNNAALAEISHARSADTDAIIMLPSSPGSFLELGAFSNIEEICTKMIVIVDAQYQAHRNYMNSGPLKAAMDNRADIRFIDYADFDRCWEVASTFVTARARKKAAKGIVTP
ncbi:MAG: hypothetical protein RL120_02545 [Gammaproteobacteria bacterium]